MSLKIPASPRAMKLPVVIPYEIVIAARPKYRNIRKAMEIFFGILDQIYFTSASSVMIVEVLFCAAFRSAVASGVVPPYLGVCSLSVKILCSY
jgi:hypothetical protein